MIRADGKVSCWGRGDHGELGDGAFRDMAPFGAATPVVVDGLDAVTQLVAGQYHLCALASGDQRVRCWGGAFKGQLGDGSLHPAEAGVPRPLAIDLPNVVQLAANGGDHTCALLMDRTVRCWGDNLFGQLGSGSTDVTPSPVAVKGLTRVVQVAAGTTQSCAVLDDATVVCWGDGGVDSTTGSEIMHVAPVPIVGLGKVASVVVGNSVACSLSDDGHVKCWGEGDIGQLGDGLSNDSNLTPVDVQGLDHVVHLAAGRNHVCALRDDRTLKCWGSGEFGQLGDGKFHQGFPNGVSSPTPATVFSDVREVACGGAHTCVRTFANAVKCAGNGNYGQLGDGKIYDTLPFGSSAAVDAITL